MDIKEVLNGNIFKVWAKFIIASVVGGCLKYNLYNGRWNIHRSRCW